MNNITRELLYGKCPVKRLEPQQGESQWYYFDPRGTDLFSEMKTIDVPTKDTPNPRDEEIRQYLYQNDNYNYNYTMLYGDNPPTTINTANNEINTSLITDDEKVLNNIDKKTLETKNVLEERETNPEIIDSDNAIFNRVFSKTLREEGGYENRASYIDTPTNMGIQQASLNRFKVAHPDLAQKYPENIKDITYSQVKQIARMDYFDKYRIGEIISEPLQETIFDSFFNHSPTAPAHWVQRAINQNTNIRIQDDGVFGSETINALNNLSQDEIVKVNNAILDMRKDDYEQERETNPNSNYEKYTKGLPNRFNRFKIK